MLPTTTVQTYYIVYIIHLQIYRPSTDDYVYYDRFFGRAVTDDTASEGK